MILHPSFRRLCRFAEDDLPAPERQRIARHFARCPRCRDTLSFLRGLSEAAAGLEAPQPSGDSLQRVLARRAAGERLILPAAAPAPARRAWALPAVAAALALLFVGAALFLRTPELEAEKSELRFLPRAPQVGQEVTVEYRATSKLAGEDRLVLRARLFPQYGMVPRMVRIAELARSGERTYRGSFRLPDSAVYALFAVEDPAGTRVDHDPAAWELMVHAPDGRPLADALSQRVSYRQMLDTELALQAAREMDRLYPDSARSGFWSYVMEGSRLDQAGKDSLTRLHRARLHRVEQLLERRGRVDPAGMAQLVFYASALDDSAVEHRWRERLIREAPRDLGAIQQRVFEISGTPGQDRETMMARLEALWKEVGPVRGQLPFTAFMSAQVAGDADAMRRWGERLERMEPGTSAMVAAALLKLPALRLEALDLARRRIRELDEPRDELRPLGYTVDDWRRSSRQEQGFFLGELGEALAAEGRTAAALDTLEQAIRAGWNVDLFRAIADTKLAIGDTAGALPVLARVAADPTTARAFEDSVRSRVGAEFDAARWDSLVAAGRQEMRADVWAQSVDQPLRGSVRLTDGQGRKNEWSYDHDGVTFVAFWSRHCPPSLMQLGQLQEISTRLRAQGVRVTTITAEPPSPELTEFLSGKGYTFPVLHDLDQDAERAFDNRATPRYLVLDAEGRIRFASYSLQDVLRQVAVLRERGVNG
jgi:thiol-disulfide isomerase/thioredoxin